MKISELLHRFTIRQISIFFSTIFMAVLVMVSFVSSYYYEKALIAKSTALVERLSQQVAEKVDAYIQDLNEMTKIPLYDDEILALLAGDEGFQTRAMSERLEVMLFSNFFSKDGVYSVMMFNSSGDSYARTKTTVYNYREDITKASFYEQAGKRGVTVTLPTGKISELEGHDDQYVFSVFRRLYWVADGDFCGSVMVSAQVDLLEEMCSQAQLSAEHRMLFSDAQGLCIYDTSSTEFGKQTDQNILSLQNGIWSKDGQQYLVTKYPIESAGWQLTSLVPVSLINREAKQTGTFVMGLNVAVFLLILVFNIVLFIKLTEPLKSLVERIRNVKAGDMSVTLEVTGRDEIAQLNQGFNEILLQMKRLIERVYQMELRHKTAELKALQSQINPHFINNTLESIYMMAVVNNDLETASMAETFGRIVKYGITGGLQRVPVRQEVRYLEDYLRIQKIRFEDKLNVVLEIDPQVMDNEIMKLLLQPIVENAICHGIEKKAGPGRVLIRGYADETIMTFVVRDDGVGVSEEALANIVADMNEFELDSASIGLRNVNERIKLTYGESYGVELFSRLGKGTVVKVMLPVIAYDTGGDEDS